MKSVIIACNSLEKELLHILNQHDSDMLAYWLPPELHVRTDLMTKTLQELINRFEDVDRIYICVSGCGCANSTKGLTATTAELVFPKTSDCIDLLLSEYSAYAIKRPKGGIYLTESWLQYVRGGPLDYAYQVRTRGPMEAYEYVNRLFKNFKDFYIIDTCASNTMRVYRFLQPLLDAIDGRFRRIPGHCGLLHKMVTHDITEDNFIIIPKGQTKED